jgi:DNA-directed RNA polymerase subunit RPC12/RpoP
MRGHDAYDQGGSPMAELTFHCQVCQTPLTASEAQVGTLVRCPMCRATLKVPTAQRVAAQEPVAAGSGLPRMVTIRPDQMMRRGTGKRYGFNCGYCSSRLEANEGMAAQEGQCPTCGNTIVIPILDRYGRLIDPITKQIIKQDPHPVHAYAAAGERAPNIVRLDDGGQAIECPRCRSMSPVSSNNCRNCGMPFTMEGTTLEAAGGSNVICVSSLVAGIIGIPTFCIPLASVIAIVLGIIGLNQTSNSGESAGRGMAIAGIVCGAVGLLLSGWMHLT